MSSAIDFYFDFSSPYGYLASTKIENLASKHGRTVNWHPILLGAVFKVSKQGPLTSFPMKGEYALMDFARSAREENTPFQNPSNFPIASVGGSRAVYWLQSHADENMSALATPLIKALFKAYFCEDQHIGQLPVVLDVAKTLGMDPEVLEAAVGEQETKDKLRSAVDKAIERGVFGSPMMIVDDEMFWGSDRLEQLDRWLTRGGW